MYKNLAAWRAFAPALAALFFSPLVAHAQAVKPPVKAAFVYVAPLTEADHVVEAILPDEFTCKYLKINKTEPCLRLTRRTFSREGAVSFAYLTSAGSRYRLGGHLNINTSGKK